MPTDDERLAVLPPEALEYLEDLRQGQTSISAVPVLSRMLADALLARQRDRARCKRAGKLVLKKSEAIRFITHHAKMATIRWQIDRRRLRRVLATAKLDRSLRVAMEGALHLLGDERDELRRRLEEALKLLSVPADDDEAIVSFAKQIATVLRGEEE